MTSGSFAYIDKAEYMVVLAGVSELPGRALPSGFREQVDQLQRLAVEGLKVWWSARSDAGRSYLRWRHVTAYGDESTTMSAQDLVNYLLWRREMRAIQKWERA